MAELRLMTERPKAIASRTTAKDTDIDLGGLMIRAARANPITQELEAVHLDLTRLRTREPTHFVLSVRLRRCVAHHISFSQIAAPRSGLHRCPFCRIRMIESAQSATLSLSQNWAFKSDRSARSLLWREMNSTARRSPIKGSLAR